ncbi:HEAT repeat domain-containing protein [Kovacikia minuta CCNUW1]|uniref:HEAT repeat domain-containing protein n=1 Tax=Kovacikia minuta TaxID=2931930 RepID=UPI001CCF23EC|nr:HEAT repeat domain-containing protein [Kovacikia minuta]UBF23904.1 HEAT repeat domain-containing protein [Kovacikia minuta CCNUW1]
MLNLLEQAEAAARQGNWASLSRYLQQALLSGQTEQTFQTVELESLLSMALLVLEFGEFQDRWDIAKVFPVFGEAAIAPLIDLLQDEEIAPESRWFATRILGGFKHSTTIQALIDVLQTSGDEELNAMAAEALAGLGIPAIAALTELLISSETRLLAVRSLAQVRHSATIEPLLGVVDDPEPNVRAIALEALSSFHHPQIPLILLKALTDPVAAVRIAAIQGLGVRSDLVAELDLVHRLAERLWDLNPQVCQHAAIALGRMGTDRATEMLSDRLKSPYTAVSLQIEIIRVLGWVGTGAALNCLQQALFSLDQAEVNPTTFQEIVTILGRWADPTFRPHAAQILINALKSNHSAVSHPQVKQCIALGLGYLKQPQAFESLIQLLADEDMGVRLHTITALKTLDSQASRQRLELLANQADLPESLKRGMAIALQEWKV